MEPAFAAPNFSRRPRLGETLRFFGILSGAEVEGALDRQANDGGRLGTCLLDSGLVDEATLAEGADPSVTLPHAWHSPQRPTHLAVVQPHSVHWYDSVLAATAQHPRGAD